MVLEIISFAIFSLLTFSLFIWSRQNKNRLAFTALTSLLFIGLAMFINDSGISIQTGENNVFDGNNIDFVQYTYHTLTTDNNPFVFVLHFVYMYIFGIFFLLFSPFEYLLSKKIDEK